MQPISRDESLTPDVMLESQAISLTDVVNAIMYLSRLDEIDMERMIRDEAFREAFPFKVGDSSNPGLRRFDEVEEAPARALTDEEYLRFLHGR